jgi:hypothetical protein
LLAVAVVVLDGTLVLVAVELVVIVLQYQVNFLAVGQVLNLH